MDYPKSFLSDALISYKTHKMKFASILLAGLIWVQHASVAQDQLDSALLSPLDETAGISAKERASAPDLMNLMLKIQRAHLLSGVAIAHEITLLDNCILPKIQQGRYSYLDGGPSAWILRSQCASAAEKLVFSCKKRFGISQDEPYPRCSIEPILLIQAALDVLGQ